MDTTNKLATELKIIFFTLALSLISCESIVKDKSDNMRSEIPGLFKQLLIKNNSLTINSDQILLVTNDSINDVNVIIQSFEKIDTLWIKRFPGIKGSVGKKGFAVFNQKREGDKKSPTGIFGLGPVFGYADSLPIKMEYKQATKNDFWIDDPTSDDYNKWVHIDEPPAVSHECMRRNDDLYKLGIVVQYNTKETISGNGSAIFVHIERVPGAPTSGCVALAEDKLLEIIKWLDPTKHPMIIMGNEKELMSFVQPLSTKN